MYASELEDDEDEVEEELHAREAADTGDSPDKFSESGISPTPITSDAKKPVAEEPHRDSSETTIGGARSDGEQADKLVPRAAHDAESK